MRQDVTRYVLSDEGTSCNIGIPIGVWEEARWRSEEPCAIEIGTVEYLSSTCKVAGYFQMRLFIPSSLQRKEVFVIKAFHYDWNGVELDDEPFIIWEGSIVLFEDSIAPSLKDLYLNFAFYWLNYMKKRSRSWKPSRTQGYQRRII